MVRRLKSYRGFLRDGIAAEFAALPRELGILLLRPHDQGNRNRFAINEAGRPIITSRREYVILS